MPKTLKTSVEKRVIQRGKPQKKPPVNDISPREFSPIDSFPHLFRGSLNVVEVAAILGVHWETVKRLCREGRIPAEKVHNTWLIHRDKLMQFAATYDDPRRGKRRDKASSRQPEWG